jgi:hypothetical protein
MLENPETGCEVVTGLIGLRNSPAAVYYEYGIVCLQLVQNALYLIIS